MTTLKNTFGIEYEVNGINIRTAAQYINQYGLECRVQDRRDPIVNQYMAVNDASCDAEVKTPIMTPNRLNETYTITSALKAAGGNVNGTNTGLHIHLGTNEWDMDDSARYNFVMNWYGVHNVHSALVANSRLNNHMCKISGRRNAEAQAELAANGSGYDDRYLSLNTDSFAKYGTFEVRLHQGSLNAKKINAWLGYLAGLILVAKDGVDISDITPMWTGYRPDKTAAVTLLNYMTNEGYIEPRNSDYLKGRINSIRP